MADAVKATALQAVYNWVDSEACIQAIEAGGDILLMPGSLREAMAGVENAVKSGRISEERIDESVRRILTAKQSMGLLSAESDFVS